MAALMGSVQGNRGEATRLGSDRIVAKLETWGGNVRVIMERDGSYTVFESKDSKSGFGAAVHTGQVNA